MRKLIFIIIILVELNVSAQEIITNWNEFDKNATLNEFIENHAYEYLNYKLTENDTLNKNGTDEHLKSSQHNSTVPNLPVVVINENPIDDKEIWKLIKLKDLYEIYLHKPNDTTSAIYGRRGNNGLIVVKMKKRKYRKLKKIR